MKKKSVLRNVLAVSLVAAMVSSMAAVSVSARDSFDGDDTVDNYFENHTIGIVGAMTGWGSSADVPMTDPDGDGIYVGIYKDLTAGDYEFKVRADSAWDDSWGVYDEEKDRTMNSQTPCKVTVDGTTDLIVMLDTNGDDEALWPVFFISTEQMEASRYSIIGSMTDWYKDIPMYEVYEGKYVGIIKDLAVGEYEFKVRADGAWNEYYGVYEEDEDRTNNSQTNCSVAIEAYEESGDVVVFFDTTGDDDQIWPLSWTVITPVSLANVYAGKPVEDEEPVIVDPVTPSKYGIVGDMTGWGAYPDFPMYETETGVYVGKTDVLSAGEYEFRVRADSAWSESYGVYKEDEDRTRNSWENIYVTLSKRAAISVMLDTTGDDDQIWPVSYKIGDGDWIYTGKTIEYETFKYKVNYDNTVTITKYTGNGGDVIIPSAIDGKSVTSIGDSAFSGCTGLTSIVIPDSVTSIGDSAFSGCTGLTSIVIPDSVTSIGRSAFSDCTGLTSIVIPDSVTSIDYYAFSGCTGLTSVTIGNSVTSIGDYTFSGCTGLTSVTIGNSVTYIGRFAFEGCTGLTSVTIGNSVTYIGRFAFEGCTGLTSVTIGNSVTYIDDSAFSGCTGLTSIEIPDSVISIDSSAFDGCTGLTSINVDKNNEKYSSYDGVMFNKDKTEIIKYPESKNGTYTIPDSVTSIGNGAFSDCRGLISVTIGNSVTYIGWSAFEGCTGLTSIVIPDSVTYIGSSAFDGCTGLTSINVDKNNEKYSSYDGVMFNKDKTEIIKYPESKNGTYTIPDSVTIIDDVTFEYCTGLTSIVIPDSVTSIGMGAFDGCTGLTSVTIGNSVTYIGWSAFGCTGLTSIEIPDSVTEIGLAAFAGCTGLTSVIIGNSVTYIGDFAFSGCTGLTSVIIGNSVTYIDDSAFSGCTGLTSIEIPDSVTYIGWSAFYGCTGLTIYGAKGSYAETYANENNIPFVSEYTNISTISEDEIALGGTVTINARAVLGNGTYTYAVCYKKKTESKWTTKQDFGTNDTVTIKPTKATDYEICVKVKDSMGKVVKKYFDLKVNAELTNTSTLSADTIILGQDITVNCIAKGGMGGYKYQVLYKQSSQKKWTTAQDFSENSTVTFKPTKATTYDVCVKVKDSSGTIIKKFFTVQVNAELANISNLSANTIALGQNITVNCLAKGGIGKYKYQVLYKQSSQSKWTTAQDFSENSNVTFKPTKATTYDVCVKVKDSDGTEVKRYFTVKVTDVLKNNSTLSKTEIALGDTITVNGKATGGSGSYQYNILYKQTAQSKWTTAQSYKANATVTIKPTKATTYDVCVKVKDSDGTEVKEYFTVNVTINELKNTSTISAETINLGESVTVNAKATGSTGFYIYAVYYKQETQKKWTTAQDFKANNKVTVKPTKATAYDICVKVKDDKGTVDKKYFKVNVTDFANISTVSETEIKLGKTIEVNCLATGSTGFYQYAVYYKKTSDTKWTMQQNYSSNNTVTFKPTEATTYDICVKVKDNQDNVVKKYFTVTVK